MTSSEQCAACVQSYRAIFRPLFNHLTTFSQRYIQGENCAEEEAEALYRLSVTVL